MEPFDYTIPENATRFQLRLKHQQAEKRLNITTPGTPEYHRLEGFLATVQLEIGKQRASLDAKLDASIDVQVSEILAMQRQSQRLTLAQRLYPGQLHKQPDPAAAADKAIELANIFFARWEQQPAT